MKKKCAIEHCGREMYYKQSGLCTACYSGLHYWKKKGVTEIVKRKGKLRVLRDRLDVLEPSVTVLRKKARGD
jgi:hypothetical protein